MAVVFNSDSDTEAAGTAWLPRKFPALGEATARPESSRPPPPAQQSGGPAPPALTLPAPTTPRKSPAGAVLLRPPNGPLARPTSPRREAAVGPRPPVRRSNTPAGGVGCSGAGRGGSSPRLPLRSAPAAAPPRRGLRAGRRLGARRLLTGGRWARAASSRAAPAEQAAVSPGRRPRHGGRRPLSLGTGPSHRRGRESERAGGRASRRAAPEFDGRPKGVSSIEVFFWNERKWDILCHEEVARKSPGTQAGHRLAHRLVG